MNKSKDIFGYLQSKYMSNSQPVYNIKYELEDGYAFEYREFFGKQGLTIKKKKWKQDD